MSSYIYTASFYQQKNIDRNLFGGKEKIEYGKIRTLFKYSYKLEGKGDSE
jgi:hypothetical protein